MALWPSLQGLGRGTSKDRRKGGKVAGGKGRIVHTVGTTDKNGAEEPGGFRPPELPPPPTREGFREKQAAQDKVRQRQAASWRRLADVAWVQAAEAGIREDRLRLAEGGEGPPPRSIGNAKAERRELRGELKLWRKGGPGLTPEGRALVAEQLRQVEAEVKELQAWRRLALHVRRVVKAETCGHGSVATTPGGGVVRTERCEVPVVDLHQCDSRTCPRCMGRAKRREARKLGSALLVGYEGLGTSPLVGVLNSRPAPEGTTLTDSADALSGAMRRFQRSSHVGRILAGGHVGMEATWSSPETRRSRAKRDLARAEELEAGAEKRWPTERAPERYRQSAARLLASAEEGGSWWHAHVSIVVVPTGHTYRTRVTVDELNALRAAWQKALRNEWRSRGWPHQGEEGPGGMVFLEEPRRGIDGAAMECAKYAVKGSDLAALDDDKLDEAQRALDGRRIFRRWGIVKEWLQAIEELRAWSAQRERELLPAVELVAISPVVDDFNPDEGDEVAEDLRAKATAIAGVDSLGRAVHVEAVQWELLTEELAWLVEVGRWRARVKWLRRLPPTPP